MSSKRIDFASGFQTNEAETTTNAAEDISVTPSGNLAADDVQEALVELQTDVDTRAPQATTYTKTEVDDALDLKADQATTYTKVETDALVDAVDDRVTATIGGAPADLDTLGEIAASIDNDPDIAGTIRTEIAAEVSALEAADDLKADAASPVFTGHLTLEELAADPAAPSAGNKQVYAKNDGKVYTQNSAGEIVEVGSGAGGGGSLNYISNPDAEINVTDGVTTSAVTVAAETAAPLIGVQSFKLTSTAATGTVDFAADAIDSAYIDSGTLLKVESFARVDTGDAGDWKIGLWDGSAYVEGTEQDLVNGMNVYRSSFIPEDGTTYSIRIEHTTADASDVVVVDSLLVGPGEVVFSNGLGAWITQNITNNSGDGVGNFDGATLSICTRSWRRNGQNMELYGYITTSAAGLDGSSASSVFFDIPGGLTYDTTVAAAQALGHGQLNNTTTVKGFFVTISGGDLQFRKYGEASDSIDGVEIIKGSSFYFYATIPIAEWSGASYVGLGEEEAAFTTGTWDAADTTTGYGHGGALMGGALTSGREKTVTWSTPTQSYHSFKVLLSQDQVSWFDANGARIGASNDLVAQGINAAGNNASGVSWRKGSTALQTIVRFEQYAHFANDDSPTKDWPSSAAYWKIVRYVKGAPNGFDSGTPTKKGLNRDWKQYTNSTVTFSSTPAGWSVIRAVFVPYQTYDGAWRLRFNIVAGQTNTTASTSATIDGVTFKNVASYNQTVSFAENSGSVYITGRVTPNTGTVNLTNNSAVNVDQFNCSGDVELESKPTWAE